MENNENLYLSTIAFLDDDAITTNERYLTEFCKIVIYQSGFSGLSLSEICTKINDLVLFSYSEEEIERILENNKQSFECSDGIYSISSEASKEISKRAKKFPLRRFVDYFCDTKYKDDDAIDRDELCNLVTRYIFEKFQQSIDQITNIIDSSKETVFEFSDKYTEEERVFLNAFLVWDNDEKNKMIYDLIVKSYDFCTINCTDENSFDFKGFHFYLDANIIMRLLGINNTYRQGAIKHFIEKCKDENIQLHISNFTKVEIQKSIEYQINAINREIDERGHIPPPSAMKFAKPESFTIEMYGKYYEYANKHKNWSLEAFKRALMGQLESCIRNFSYDENESFEVLDRDRFNNYVSSLKERKDPKVVKTDVNNVMLVLKSRESNTDSCMISADGKLINWCREIFVGKQSIVEFPSTWFSIIMKYTGRASSDDYASFCRFIRLPIYATDKDLRMKIEVKKRILAMDTTSNIKDRMFEELENNYSLYSESLSSKQIAEEAYEAIMKEHDNRIIETIEKQKQKEIDNITNKNELAKQSLIKQIKEKDALISHQQTRNVDSKLEDAIKDEVSKRLKIGEWITDYYNRICLFIVGLVILFFLACIFLLRPNINNDFLMNIITVLDFLIGGLIFLLINAFKEYFTNAERLESKFSNKLRKKYKALL